MKLLSSSFSPAGHEVVVKLLLAAPGIEVNASDTRGRTPLRFAAENSHEAVVKLLLAAPRIDVNAPDTDGRTPLCFAAQRGHEAIVKLLLTAPGIDVSVPDTDGRTPLIFAAIKGHEGVVQLLLAIPGVDVNAPDTKGWTPLIHAVWNNERGSVQVRKVPNLTADSLAVKLLLAASGIEVNVADTSGWSALTWAAFEGKEDIARDLCAVPEIIVDVAGVKRRIENPPGGPREEYYSASKDEQAKCVRILEEFLESKGSGAQDGSERIGPSAGRRPKGRRRRKGYH
ncbi:ankyrin repeat-containing domain protein [Ephemerocybe angulata]|uniref:Ankyrin repeat-containing domain protein n=1 Tax=Ephemerocybe angulata TaxID=980116 RepID=A0A8H6MF42_9AGAR|nr:ankyrin repeat-containing domain protein [Tulosesus angulatus]